MNDLKPFQHGEEGTHSVCKNRLKKEGGKATCCVCNPHENCGKKSGGGMPIFFPPSNPQESGGDWETEIRYALDSFVDADFWIKRIRSEIESSYSKGLEEGRKEILVMLGIINEMEDSPQKREQLESLLSSLKNKEK